MYWLENQRSVFMWKGLCSSIRMRIPILSIYRYLNRCICYVCAHDMYFKFFASLTFVFSHPFSLTSITTAFNRASTVEAPKMMIDGSVLESAASTANLIATSSDANGGAFFPVAGIVSLAALILYLAPPLVDSE